MEHLTPSSRDDHRLSLLTQPVSILMPVCNESDIIEQVVEEWHHEVIRFLPQGSELVFDDASDDQTPKILKRLQQRYTYIQVHSSPKDGFGNATKRLYLVATNPLVFFVDSDGQYLASDFWKLAKVFASKEDGFDMLNGYKVDRKHPLYQIVGSWLFNVVVRQLFASKGKDINSAFKLMKRDFLEKQVPALQYVPTFVNSELYLRAEAAGYCIADISVSHRIRDTGKSKVSTPLSYLKHGWQTILGLFKLRRALNVNEAMIRSRRPRL